MRISRAMVVLTAALLVLEDATEVHYQISAFYAPESAAGFCYDDPRVGIEWPRAITVISAKDRALPSFEEVMRGT